MNFVETTIDLGEVKMGEKKHIFFAKTPECKKITAWSGCWCQNISNETSHLHITWTVGDTAGTVAKNVIVKYEDGTAEILKTTAVVRGLA